MAIILLLSSCDLTSIFSTDENKVYYIYFLENTIKGPCRVRGYKEAIQKEERIYLDGNWYLRLDNEYHSPKDAEDGEKNCQFCD